MNEIIQGDSLTILSSFPAESVDCCITSPPYWGLRDYGTANWEGGDENCEHTISSGDLDPKKAGQQERVTRGERSKCTKCGAKRVDSQLGLEKTPEEYVANMVKVFAEVKRVLKKEGTLWLNLGDSYNSGTQFNNNEGLEIAERYTETGLGKKWGGHRSILKNLKPKDLVGIPWRVAFALQADGWYLRQDIIWAKPNPMPESVTDRCTKSHEYIFLMSKSPKYYFDNEAIKEVAVAQEARGGGNKAAGAGHNNLHKSGDIAYLTRNRRSVWTISTKPFSEAHFATFPEDLIVPMVKAGCPLGGVVLDPFMGAGTTGLVARKLQRNYLGIELNPAYVEIAERRIRNLHPSML